MPSLEQLVNNLPTFKYYGGYGTFNENNLPYGNDQPGGGSSNQPFIKRKPDQRWSPSNFDVAGIATTTTRTVADLLRVGKFLTTTTQGLGFLANQTGLQMMNPDLEHEGNLKTNKAQTGQGFFGNISNTISNTANRITNTYGPTRIYNPLGINTLAEVGLVGFGGHVMKHGMTPKVSVPSAYEQFIVTKDRRGLNRLTTAANNITTIGFIDSRFPLFTYKGGPDSMYGIGDTQIKMAIDYGRSNSIVERSDSRSGFVYMPINYMMGNTKRGISYTNTTYAKGTYTLGEFQDFRAIKNDINATRLAGGTVLQSTDYATKHVQRRIGVPRTLTDQERKNLNGSYSDATILGDSVDKVNMVSLYYSDSPSKEYVFLTDINGNDVGSTNIRDIIKFRIKALDNDSSNGGGVYMVFRAFITGVKRGVQAKWNPYNYVGRGESFYAYDGFTETISVQFTIAASSRLEMKPLYQKLNYLISTLTPDYSGNRMRGNIMELTIGDFIKYQPGVITNLDMTIDEETQWEIALDEPENGVERNMHELPMMIKCNMTFIPIYNFLPRKSSQAPFIGIDDLEGTAKNWMENTDAGLKILKSDLPGINKEQNYYDKKYENSIINHNNHGNENGIPIRDVTKIFSSNANTSLSINTMPIDMSKLQPIK